MIATLDVDGWRRHKGMTGEDLHVVIDGDDVTSDCYRAAFHADMAHGDVWLFRRDARGLRYVDAATGEAAREMRTGLLVIRPGAPLA